MMLCDCYVRLEKRKLQLLQIVKKLGGLYTRSFAFYCVMRLTELAFSEWNFQGQGLSQGCICALVPTDPDSIPHAIRGKGTVMEIITVSNAKLATSGSSGGFRTILST